MPKQRIEYIDVAKGLLIIMMVIAHIWQSGYVNIFIYNFHMSAFFIISGMLLNYSKTLQKSYFQIVKSRIFTIGIPFCFFEVCGCIMYYIRYGFHQNIKGFIYNTLHLDFNNGVNWFLFTIFFGELIFMALLKFCKKDLLIISAASVSLIVALITPLFVSDKYVIVAVRMLLCIALLAGGYYLNKYLQTKNVFTIILSFCVLLVLTICKVRVDVASLSFTNPLLFVLSSLCGVYLVLQTGKLLCKLPFINNIIKFFGENTLIILGTHNLLYVIIGNALGISDFAQTPLLLGLLLFCIVILLEVPIIYLLNRFAPFLVGKKIRKKQNTN